MNPGSEDIPFSPERLWLLITLAGSVVISVSAVHDHRNGLILGFKS